MGKATKYSDIKEMVENAGYKLNDVYIKNEKKLINITCPNGHTYDKRLDGFKNGERCMQCRKLSYNEVKMRVEHRGYKLLSTKYVNVGEKLRMECPNGHEIEMKFNNFHAGKGCSICANNVTHSYEYIKTRIEKEGYILLSETYKNGYEKLRIQCPKGHIYEAPYNSFRGGHRCPLCPVSLGENRIKYILENKNIKFLTHHYFKDCVYRSYLYFDFYLPQCNLCIEYDGRQHFELVNWGNMTKEEMQIELLEVQNRDNVKNKYCEENDMRLLRIPYWEFDKIEDILLQNLK